jgi:hypothetical protein
MNIGEYLNLTPVLLTGLFAFAGTWAGSRFSHVNEHNQWLRNEKMAACSEFLTAAERLVDCDLKSRNSRQRADALQNAHNLSHVRLTLVSPMDVSSAAVKYREAIVDLAALVVERSRVGPDAVWDDHIDKAFQKTHHAKIRFVLESSKDLNSGMFKGLGPLRSITLILVRWRVRHMQKGLA